MLELAIQHGEEKKVDYNPLDRLVGVYQDIVESGMLTVEEYAASTNETIAEVNRRVRLAQLLAEYLCFIGMPGQYYAVRENQIVSILSDLQDLLRHCTDSQQAEQLKKIVFTNMMMKTIGDGRKYIKNLSAMMTGGLLPVYIKEQEKLGQQVQQRRAENPPETKAALDRFVSENEELADDLQLSLDKSLLKAKRTETSNKLSQLVSKSITMLKDVDTRIFEKLSDGEKDKLRTQVSKLSQMVERFDSLIEDGPEAAEPAAAQPPANRYLIAPMHPLALQPKCMEMGKPLNSLSFSLAMTGCSDAGQPESATAYQLSFINERQERVSNVEEITLTREQPVKRSFVLNAQMSRQERCLLAVRDVRDGEDCLQLLLPFDIQMLFSADTDF